MAINPFKFFFRKKKTTVKIVEKPAETVPPPKFTRPIGTVAPKEDLKPPVIPWTPRPSGGGGGSGPSTPAPTPTPKFKGPTRPETDVEVFRTTGESIQTQSIPPSRRVDSIRPAPISPGVFDISSRTREAQIRETARLSLPAAITLATKQSFKERGSGRFVTTFKDYLGRVGVEKEFSKDLIPTKEVRDPFGGRGTVTEQKFFDVDPKLISSREEIKLKDIRAGISPDLAGKPIPVATNIIGEKISKDIQTKIDTGEITLEQGQKEFDVRFKKRTEEFISKTGTDRRLDISSGLGEKVIFGTTTVGLGLASLTPVGAAAVGAGFVATSVPEFGKAALGTQFTTSERVKAGLTGATFAGLGFAGLGTGVFSRGPRGLLAQETRARQEFLIKSSLSKVEGERVLLPKGRGVDILKTSAGDDITSLTGDFVIPFKVKGDKVISQRGKGVVTLVDEVPFTGEKIITTQQFGDIRGVTKPSKFLKATDGKGKVFESTGSFREGVGLQSTILKESGKGRLVLGKGFKGKKLAEVDVIPGTGVKQRFGGLGEGESIKIPTGEFKQVAEDIFEPVTKEFVLFKGAKPIGSVSKVIRKKGGIKETTGFIEADIKERGRLEVIDLTKAFKQDGVDDILSTASGGLQRGLKPRTKQVQVPPSSLTIPVIKQTSRTLLKTTAPIKRISSPTTIATQQTGVIATSPFAGTGIYERTTQVGILPGQRLDSLVGRTPSIERLGLGTGISGGLGTGLSSDTKVSSRFRDFTTTTPAFRDTTKFKEALKTGQAFKLQSKIAQKAKLKFGFTPIKARPTPRPFIRPGLVGLVGFTFPGFPSTPTTRRTKRRPTRRGKVPRRSPTLDALGLQIFGKRTKAELIGAGALGTRRILKPTKTKKKKKK